MSLKIGSKLKWHERKKHITMETIKMYLRTSKKSKECGKQNDTVGKKNTLYWRIK